MKTRFSILVLLGLTLVCGGAHSTMAKSVRGSIGPGHGIAPQRGRTSPCPGATLLQNADGSYENGYTWWYGGQVAPYYGAFAEGYNTIGTVCGQQWAITTESGMYFGQKADAYIGTPTAPTRPASSTSTTA